jgi:hypothetical protein
MIVFMVSWAGWAQGDGVEPMRKVLQMTRWTYLLAGVAVMALCAQSVAKEQPAPGEPVTWHAASNTADSITGDVVYLPNSLTFANGTSLAMTAVANAPAPWAMFSSGSGGDGEIYKLESPADPELLNGNKLCGMPGQPVTHVMIAPNPKGDEMVLGVFTGEDAPTAKSEPCATYSYEL